MLSSQSNRLNQSLSAGSIQQKEGFFNQEAFFFCFIENYNSLKFKALCNTRQKHEEGHNFKFGRFFFFVSGLLPYRGDWQ